MPTNTTIDYTPRVWVGCLACYNGGNLRGEWVDAIDAADLTTEELHGGATTHEELWCFDHENLPIRGEISPMDATAWAEALEDIEDDQRAAFDAYADNVGKPDTPEELQDLASSFEDAYMGESDSVRDYCESYADDAGMFQNVPDHMVTYFDWDAYARDVEMEMTVLDAPGGGVFVFTS